MIEPYWGEFLVSPIPLELSLNFCSHKCAYCFANLNNPKRTGDVKAIMRLLVDYKNRETLEALYLQQGFPVLVSNRTDPFSYSNYRSMLPILQALTELEIPVVIQTKGGPGALEALEFLKPAVWYISVSTLDDDLRRKIEPGAPTVDSRFELMQAVRAKGGRVVLGYNPCVPEWQPDQAALVNRAKDCGAEGVWVEELHLNYRQEANLTPAERLAIGEDLITRARMKRRDGLDKDNFFATRQAVLDAGLELYSIGQPCRSDFWQIYRDVYPKTLQTNQDFVNYCYDNGLDGQVIGFDTWASVISKGLPEGRYRMNKYIGGAAMSIFETYRVPSKLTYQELLGVVWSMQRAKQCPVRMPSFSWAALMGENGWIKLFDQRDFPYLVFGAAGDFRELYTQVVMEWQAQVEVG